MKIVWLHDPAARDPDLVGSRAASLSALTGRYPVPPGFSVTAITMMEEEPLPPAAVTTLLVAYNQLAKRTGTQAPAVSIHPAWEEEGAPTSPDGSILHVTGLDAVAAAVSRCLSAAGPEQARQGVIIQQAVVADVTGVAFSHDPSTGDGEQVLIASSWGLACTSVAPDRYRVARAGLALAESRVGEKRRMRVAVRGESVEVDVPRLLRGEPTLSTEQAQEVARLLLALEAERGHPVAIEFAFEGERLHLLRAGPLPVDGGHARSTADGGHAAVPAADPPALSAAAVGAPPQEPDLIHAREIYPGQALPMFAAFFDPWAVAWNRENPSARCEFRRIYTYLYHRYLPSPDPPPEVEPILTPGQLQTLWQREILPEVQFQCLQLANLDLTAIPRHALRPQLEELVERYILVWELHWRIANPVDGALARYQELYGELFAPHEPLEGLTLLQGFENRGLEVERELWRLSRQIPHNPHLRTLFAERSAEEIVEALPDSPAGQDLLERLRPFLDRYGRRFPDRDWTRPSWREEITPAIRAMQAHLTDPEHHPGEEATRRAEEREAAVAAARERLAGYPRPVRERFEKALRAAQAAIVLQEEYRFWISHWAMYEVRRAMLSLGMRLAGDGLIDSPDEIWYLTLDEVREVLSGPPVFSLRARLAERGAELARWAEATPPPRLGGRLHRRPAEPTGGRMAP